MADREKTVKELQDELVGQGFDKEVVLGIRTKSALIAMISALREKSAVVTLTPTKDPKEEKNTEKSWQAKADKMAKHLEKQDKVRVLIPLEPKEKVGVVKEVKVRGILQYRHVSGAVWSKTFNGYKIILPKGVYTNVPEQIADNIGQGGVRYRPAEQPGRSPLSRLIAEIERHQAGLQNEQNGQPGQQLHVVPIQESGDA